MFTKHRWNVLNIQWHPFNKHPAITITLTRFAYANALPFVSPTRPPALPDENFNKKPNSAKSHSDCLKGRKKPNCICGISMPLSQKKHFNYKNIKTNYLKLRLSLPWHCTGAHYWCFSDFSWFVRLHTWVKDCDDPSAVFCTHTKVISHSLLYLRPESLQLFPEPCERLLGPSQKNPDGAL